MSARIAPEPISLSISPVVEFRPRGTGKDWRAVAAEHLRADSAGVQTSPEQAPAPEVPAPPPLAEQLDLPPLPEPPAPPGTAYVRAVLSGALSPRPTSLEEVFLRVGTGWTPPDSEYRLADKTI